ncbi:MAG: carboxypeptidase regulatory-like domain-containing protein [Saprospiraceae bacterium]|nr:carboxypeptidase regulatory-like domain-containing protein [Saprospiraceae bacterium]
MEHQILLSKIRQFIALDDMPTALKTMRSLLENTPNLNEALQQSGRLEKIQREMRLGLVSDSEARLEQNRIRFGVLELLTEIEQKGLSAAALGEVLSAVEQESTRPELKSELEHAVSIVNSKNVVVGSNISAGGNITIGDQTIHTESQTSKNLRLFLYFFVPLLALGGAFLWYRLQPVSLTVAVQYSPANPDLAFEKGEITLHHGGRQEVKTIEKEAIFTDIQRGERVNLHFAADGFLPIDTTFEPSGAQLILPIRRDTSLARVFGTVRDGQGKALGGVTIRVQDMTIRTLPDGSFSLPVPPEKQRKKQRVEAIVDGKVVWDYTQPIIPNVSIQIQL